MSGNASRQRVWRSCLVALGVSLAVSTAAGASRWGADYFPNVSLTDHEGTEVHFFDDLVKDKVVAINFIYTSCPDACPLETARLLEVQRILGDRVGRDVFMYSITIDPEVDTPEVLNEYVRRFQVGDGWRFLTGTEEDITLLRKKLGLYIAEIQADDSNDHNLSLIIGNQKTGRWMKRSPFENPYVLATQIGGWLHNWKAPSEGEADYASAPELRTPERGEMLFRTRCQACHTIGGGDISQPELRKVGPDLLGVVDRRDHDWLTRWLEEPEVMLEEGDPIATALLAQYNDVPMPNMRLTPVDIDAVMAYMDEESRRQGWTAEVAANREPQAAEEPAGEKPCCKKKKLEERRQEAEAAASIAGSVTEPRRPMSTASILFSAVGCALLLAGAAIRRG